MTTSHYPVSRCFYILIGLLGPLANGQWANYREPGTPRLPSGKADLAAPAPRTFDRKPDLSGVWRHTKSTPEELRELFGGLADDFEKLDVPGMEISSVHKYGANLLFDFKPGESPARPEAIKLMAKEPNLIRRPLIVRGKQVIFGFDEEAYRKL